MCLLDCLQGGLWQSQVLGSAEHARPEALQRTAVQAQLSLSPPALCLPAGSSPPAPASLALHPAARGSKRRRGPSNTHPQRDSSLLPHSSPIQQTGLLPTPQVPSSLLLSLHSASHTAHFTLPQTQPRSAVLRVTHTGEGLALGLCNRRCLQQTSVLVVEERQGKRG